MKNLIIVRMPELGWDNIVCVASSMKAAAFDLELSVEELKKDKQYRIEKHTIVMQEEDD
jgi:hypothetical protein